jgi:hypothetical protein
MKLLHVAIFNKSRAPQVCPIKAANVLTWSEYDEIRMICTQNEGAATEHLLESLELRFREMQNAPASKPARIRRQVEDRMLFDRRFIEDEQLLHWRQIEDKAILNIRSLEDTWMYTCTERNKNKRIRTKDKEVEDESRRQCVLKREKLDPEERVYVKCTHTHPAVTTFIPPMYAKTMAVRCLTGPSRPFHPTLMRRRNVHNVITYSHSSRPPCRCSLG